MIFVLQNNPQNTCGFCNIKNSLGEHRGSVFIGCKTFQPPKFFTLSHPRFFNNHPFNLLPEKWFEFYVVRDAKHSMVVSLWDVTESLYMEILRSDGSQKGLADVDLTHLKSYGVIHTIYIAVLGQSKSLWVIKFNLKSS